MNEEMSTSERVNNMMIAKTILEQLGGNKFIVMTGAKEISAEIDGALRFKLPRAKDGINLVKIKLNGLDLYDVTYSRLTFSMKKLESTNKVKAESKDVFCGDLRGNFESVTGLRTSLTEVYA